MFRQIQLNHKWLGRIAVLLVALMTITLASPIAAQQDSFESETGNKYLSGESFDVNEDTEGDLFSTGNEVNIGGNVGDNAFIAGGEVEINGDVSDDLYVAGGAVLVDGNVEGDVMVASGYLVVNGDIAGDLRIGAGEAYINSETIGGDLLVGAGRLDLSSQTVVEGEITVDAEDYDSSATNNPTDLSDADNSQWSMFWGETTEDGVEFPAAALFAGQFIWSLVSLIATIIAAYVFLKMFPSFSEKTLVRMKTKPGTSLLIGILTMILAPIAIILLFITVFGYKLAGLTILLGFLAVQISGFYAKYSIGRYLLKRIGKVNTGRALALILGVLLVDLSLAVIGVIPVLGWFVVGLVNTLLIGWGLGAIVGNKFTSLRSKNSSK
jgi:cytoskeletal protein CcmA (bactofilin family)